MPGDFAISARHPISSLPPFASMSSSSPNRNALLQKKNEEEMQRREEEGRGSLESESLESRVDMSRGKGNRKQMEVESHSESHLSSSPPPSLLSNPLSSPSISSSANPSSSKSKSSLRSTLSAARHKLPFSSKSKGSSQLASSEEEFQRMKDKEIEKQKRKEEYERLGLKDKVQFGQAGGMGFHG